MCQIFFALVGCRPRSKFSSLSRFAHASAKLCCLSLPLPIQFSSCERVRDCPLSKVSSLNSFLPARSLASPNPFVFVGSSVKFCSISLYDFLRTHGWITLFYLVVAVDPMFPSRSRLRLRDLVMLSTVQFFLLACASRAYPPIQFFSHSCVQVLDFAQFHCNLVKCFFRVSEYVLLSSLSRHVLLLDPMSKSSPPSESAFLLFLFCLLLFFSFPCTQVQFSSQCLVLYLLPEIKYDALLNSGTGVCGGRGYRPLSQNFGIHYRYSKSASEQFIQQSMAWRESKIFQFLRLIFKLARSVWRLIVSSLVISLEHLDTKFGKIIELVLRNHIQIRSW